MRRFKQTISQQRAMDAARQDLENELADKIHQCLISGADCRCVIECINGICKVMCSRPNDADISVSGNGWDENALK